MKSVSRRAASPILACLWIFASLGHATSADKPRPVAQHVIIISIDGMRPDAIDAARANTLSRLIREGVIRDDYRRGSTDKATIFSILQGAGLKSAMFFSKDKLYYLTKPCAPDFVFADPRGAGTTCSQTAASGLAADTAAFCGHRRAQGPLRLISPVFAAHTSMRGPSWAVWQSQKITSALGLPMASPLGRQPGDGTTAGSPTRSPSPSNFCLMTFTPAEEASIHATTGPCSPTLTSHAGIGPPT